MTGYPACVSHSLAVRLLLLAQTLHLIDHRGLGGEACEDLLLADRLPHYDVPLSLVCSDCRLRIPKYANFNMHGGKAQLMKSIQCRSAAPSS